MRAQFNKNKISFVNGVVDHYSGQLATKFAIDGCNLENEKFVRDFALCVEGIRSGLYRSIGIEHPFQELMDDVIKQMESDGDLEVEYEDDEDPTELY